MNVVFKRSFISLYFIISSSFVFGATVSGKVTDENSEPLPYVSIYLQGTTQGVTTNKEGVYSIDLPEGEQTLVFQYIGYKQHAEHVNVVSKEQKITLNVKMEPQPYEIGEFTVRADGEDPAYEVMRKAIKMRRYYLNQVQSYSCDVYIKGLQRVSNYPKKFMGFDVNAEGDIDLKTGIFYLSESVSKFYFKQPDKVHEVMVSSKVSGKSKTFSWNRTGDLLMNFYQNVVDVRMISKRGFVSPVAEGAMFYYNFHLAGTFYENGKLVNKVQVTPKRKSDPVFRGYIYICENTWRIHSTDLYLIKDAGIEFIDTLRINDVFLPVKTSSPEDDIWMLFSNKLTFSFSVLGFKGNGMYLSIHSKYNVKPDFTVKNPFPSQTAPPAPVFSLSEVEKKTKEKAQVKAKAKAEAKEKKAEDKIFSTGEMMKVEDDANKKDSSYWESVRPVPLTEEEVTDYQKKDSVQEVHESKPFLDSVDRKTNRFKPANLVFGYDYVNRYKKRNTSFSSLLESIQYNTVQGLVLGSEIRIRRKYELEKQFIKSVSGYYGFSDQRWNVSGQLLYEYNPKSFSHVAMEGGRKTVQFSEKKPILPLVNSVYTLFLEQNYMKLYQKDFIKLSYNSELTNGVYFRSSLEYADRSPLMNTADFVLMPWVKNQRIYSANDPLNDRQDSTPFFQRNQSMELRINLRLRYRQKYITRPDDKWVYGSKYPTLHIEYRKGIRELMDSDVNYDFLRIGITDRMNFKLLGKATYLVSAGKFLNNRKVEFMDYYHFSGNKTMISNFDFSDFQLLDYYTYSTQDYFLEGHYEHDFGGFVFNKFPLLRKLKLSELAGVHYLYTGDRDHYAEVFLGIEKFNIARGDFVMAYSKNGQLATGFRVGLKIGKR